MITLLITWFDNWFSPLEPTASYVSVFSFDKGLNFSNEFPLNSIPIDLDLTGLRNNDYRLGRYNNSGIINGKLLGLWTDTRSSDGNIELYTVQYPIRENFEELVFNNSFVISDPFPNPSNGEFSIELELSKNEYLQIDVCDLLGKKIIQIHDGFLFPGKYLFSSNIRDVEEGNYFVRVINSNNRLVKKISLVK